MRNSSPEEMCLLYSAMELDQFDKDVFRSFEKGPHRCWNLCSSTSSYYTGYPSSTGTSLYRVPILQLCDTALLSRGDWRIGVEPRLGKRERPVTERVALHDLHAPFRHLAHSKSQPPIYQIPETFALPTKPLSRTLSPPNFSHQLHTIQLPGSRSLLKQLPDQKPWFSNDWPELSPSSAPLLPVIQSFSTTFS